MKFSYKSFLAGFWRGLGCIGSIFSSRKHVSVQTPKVFKVQQEDAETALYGDMARIGADMQAVLDRLEETASKEFASDNSKEGP